MRYAPLQIGAHRASEVRAAIRREPQPRRGRDPLDDEQCARRQTERGWRNVIKRALKPPAGGKPVSGAAQTHGAKLHRLRPCVEREHVSAAYGR
jgi:hypothetical protein